MISGKPPLKRGTKVKAKPSGEIGTIEDYEGDEFYRVAFTDEGRACSYFLHTEDFDVLEEGA
jgi:hypothetical protein